MPMYDYLCPKCGDECEKLAPVSQRQNQKCAQCGETLDQIHKPQRHYKPFNPYFDIGLGVEVQDKAHRAKVMRQNGLDFRDHISKGDLSKRNDKIADQKRANRSSSYLGTIFSR